MFQPQSLTNMNYTQLIKNLQNQLNNNNNNYEV